MKPDEPGARNAICGPIYGARVWSLDTATGRPLRFLEGGEHVATHYGIELSDLSVTGHRNAVDYYQSRDLSRKLQPQIDDGALVSWSEYFETVDWRVHCKRGRRMEEWQTLHGGAECNLENLDGPPDEMEEWQTLHERRLLGLAAEPIPLIVTGKPEFAAYIIERCGLPADVEIRSTVAEDDIRGRHVYGMLPPHLGQHADPNIHPGNQGAEVDPPEGE